MGGCHSWPFYATDLDRLSALLEPELANVALFRDLLAGLKLPAEEAEYTDAELASFDTGTALEVEQKRLDAAHRITLLYFEKLDMLAPLPRTADGKVDANFVKYCEWDFSTTLNRKRPKRQLSAPSRRGLQHKCALRRGKLANLVYFDHVTHDMPTGKPVAVLADYRTSW